MVVRIRYWFHVIVHLQTVVIRLLRSIFWEQIQQRCNGIVENYIKGRISESRGIYVFCWFLSPITSATLKRRNYPQISSDAYFERVRQVLYGPENGVIICFHIGMTACQLFILDISKKCLKQKFQSFTRALQRKRRDIAQFYNEVAFLSLDFWILLSQVPRSSGIEDIPLEK